MYLFKSIIIIFFSFFCLTTYAQLDGVKQKDVKYEDNLFLDGETTDYYTGETLVGVTIYAVVDGETIAKGTSDEKGGFKLVLEWDKIYTISFLKPGYISKSITMSTQGVPEKKRFKCPDMSAEITLFKPSDCIKSEMLEKPIGRAVYFEKNNVIDWDMAYSQPLIEGLNKMLDDCIQQEEEQKRLEEEKKKNYEEAMKVANKAFTKEDWAEAKSFYNKAIEIFNDKEEPKAKLQLIETEIAKKAEAEKKREEEKLRAEAEEKARLEAENAAKNAAKNAAVEKQAKQIAEKEALARAEAEEKEKKKAELAAIKENKEKLAKEKAELEANAKKEAKKRELAEQKAKKEKDIALEQMKVEQNAKELAQIEAKKRAKNEEEALKEQKVAKKQELIERQAKEVAAQQAKKAEQLRQENKQKLLEEKQKVNTQLVQQELEQKQQAKKRRLEEEKKSEEKGRSSIVIKRPNPTRHLYQKPNKHRAGKGPIVKKRPVF